MKSNKFLFNKKKLFNTSVAPEMSVTSETENDATGPVSYGSPFRPTAASLTGVIKKRKVSIRASASVARVKRFFARSKSKRQNMAINVFSLHGCSSLLMIKNGPKACGKKLVFVAWLTCVMQVLTLISFTSFYQSQNFHVVFSNLRNRWRADCSEIDRCHRFTKSMLLVGDKRANYVCSAKLSNRLPLWSNAKHCAECPPLANNLTTAQALTAPFGLIDETATTYFDFWSERRGEPILKQHPLLQVMHDVNGPYDKTCSLSRATNAFGLAGVDGSDYCVDCFGNTCSRSSYSKPEVQNIMTAAHCKERFACDAFNYDGGRCNKAFFNTVCNTSTASVGDKPTYPRRFSDLPGFGWFRNWPHSFEESCVLTTKLHRLKTADGRYINASEHHRLRALCHLHTRCVREHPDAQCDSGTCPQTAEARLRQGFASEDYKSALWTMGVPLAAHTFEFGGTILWPPALFMFFLVASEIAYAHTSASQYLVCLDVAQEEQPFGASKTCGFKACQCAARALLVIVRDIVTLALLAPTVTSILSVKTSFDIVFNGAIAVAILQADQQVFGTIMTDATFIAVAQDYALMLTKNQHRRLQTELTVVCWSAFFWMTLTYVVVVLLTPTKLLIPDSSLMLLTIISTMCSFGFVLTTDLVVEICCICREISEGVKISKRQMARRFGFAAIRKIVALFLLWLLFMLLEAIYNEKNKQLQAAWGDIKYEIPPTPIGTSFRNLRNS